MMPMSSGTSLGGSTVGGEGFLRGLPRPLLAGTSEELPVEAALARPLHVCAATAAAQSTFEMDLVAPTYTHVQVRTADPEVVHRRSKCNFSCAVKNILGGLSSSTLCHVCLTEERRGGTYHPSGTGG